MIQKGHVRRPKGKRFEEKYTIPTVKHPPPPQPDHLASNVRKWNCCTVHFTCWSDNKWLTICELSSREVAIAHGGPSMFSIYTRWRSMSPTKVVQSFLDQQKINLLEWPRNSPDLNPTENLCLKLKNSCRTATFQSPRDTTCHKRSLGEDFGCGILQKVNFEQAEED